MRRIVPWGTDNPYALNRRRSRHRWHNPDRIAAVQKLFKNYSEYWEIMLK